MIDPENADTQAPRTRSAETRAPLRPASSLMQVDTAGETHPGKVRHNNEDHFLIARFGRFVERVATNLPTGDVALRTEEIGYGLLVADGMGGHAAGETASKLAIRTLIDLALATPDWILRSDDSSYSKELIRRFKDRFAHINVALTEVGRSDPKLRGLGTTLTVTCNLGRDLYIFHVGDSRACLYRTGRLRQLTRDHTYAQVLADQGIIAPEEVATHRMKHVLIQALGSEGWKVEPDVLHLALEDGDTLLLCTDGLTDMVPGDEIAAVLASGRSAADACHLLVDMALRAGGKDNVTVLTAIYRFPPDG